MYRQPPISTRTDTLLPYPTRFRAGRMLLQRRAPTGVWAALWSLPEADTHENAREWFDAHLDGDYDRGEPLDAIAHGFTHYRLTLLLLRWSEVEPRALVRDNEDLRWVARDELSAIDRKSTGLNSSH